MKRIVLAIFLACSSATFATELLSPDDLFSAARQSYDAGQYSDAIATYDALLAQGWQSPEIYFNRGNALTRLGKTGAAIASYQTALLLNPRDADTLANLKFVRSNAGLSASKQTRLHRVLSYLTPREWRLLAVIAWWSFAIFLSLHWLVTRRMDWVRQAWTLSLLVLLIALAARAYTWRQERNPLVVVTAKGAQTLYAPLPDATHFFDAPEGSTLQLVEQTGDWLRVKSGQQVGWLPASFCSIVRVAP